MTVHSETGFVTDPNDDSDIPLLRALQEVRLSNRRVFPAF